MGAVALGIIALDQLTKWVVLKYLGYAQERVVIDGFFKFVHWGNTGAAWSMFHGNNELLAIISLVALMLLFLNRKHFEAHTFMGQIALGLMFGGITGNLIDRLWIYHVIDFIYFYVYRRSGGESGFPAFNVADSAICVGVGLLFIMSWRNEQAAASTAST
jgi:signal peptidase II